MRLKVDKENLYLYFFVFEIKELNSAFNCCIIQMISGKEGRYETVLVAII